MVKENKRKSHVEKRVFQLLEESFIKEYLEEIDYGKTGELLVINSMLCIHKYDEGQIEKGLNYNNIKELDSLARDIANQADVPYNKSNRLTKVELGNGIRVLFTVPDKSGKGFTMSIKKVIEDLV